jgi:hypothetical protein
MILNKLESATTRIKRLIEFLPKNCYEKKSKQASFEKKLKIIYKSSVFNRRSGQEQKIILFFFKE